ncbi:hypothetical protein D9M70_508580 [compost metagenome]
MLDLSAVHHHDLVGHGHGLGLVVGHVDHRPAQPLVQLLDLAAHLHAQLGIKVRERLVEEEGAWVAHDGAAHGDTLALAAGEFPRQAVEQLFQTEDFGGLGHALVDLRLRRTGEFQRETHVLRDLHVRIERVGLEDHGDVTLLRRHVVDDLAADSDLAG